MHTVVALYHRENCWTTRSGFSETPHYIHLMSSLFLIWKGFRKYVFGCFVFFLISFFLNCIHQSFMFITKDFTRVLLVLSANICRDIAEINQNFSDHLGNFAELLYPEILNIVSNGSAIFTEFTPAPAMAPMSTQYVAISKE